MKNTILIVMLLTALGCKERTTEAVVTGNNGQSCSVSGPVINCGASQYVIAANTSNCSIQQSAGGAIITCGNSTATISNGTNGINGTNGTNGINGGVTSVIVTDYNTSACVPIAGTNGFVQPNGPNLGLYSSAGCASNTKFAEISQGEAYWISASNLGTWNNGFLRVITF